MKTLKLIILLVLFANLGFAQQTPGPKQTKDIAILGAKAHLGNGQVIENSCLVIKDGKIATIANAEVVKLDVSNMEVIKANGKHIYPGFIAPNSTLGLAEVDAVRASRDFNEVGSMNPHIRSIIAYNTESKVVESMRPNGVLMAQITPRGGRISGTSSVVQLDAWNWEDALIKENDGIHLNWPNTYSSGRWWLGEPNVLKVNKNYAKQVEALKTYFKESKAYNATNNTTKNLPFEALQRLLDGTSKLYIHVEDEKGIIDAITFAKAENVKQIVIVGGLEATETIDLLKKHNIPVLVQRVHSRPHNDDDDYDQAYKLATTLTNAGVLVGLENAGDMERMNTRNLPFLAGTCVAHGLTKAQALSLITLNTAKILGVDNKVGSLEVGKDATFFISEGDALDMRTNKISKAYIQGRDVSLETHQTKLYKRYSEKYKK